MANAEQSFSVTHPNDCVLIQNAARKMALNLGFPNNACEEVALVTTELASNLVKHARGGELILRPLKESRGTGIEIETHDQGPGITDMSKALADGYSTAGSLGYGLGTVNRLMDELDIASDPGSSTRIVCRRWVRPVSRSALPRLFDCGVFTRARDFAAENGDAFIIKEWNNHLLVGIIDGLGHGQFAQRAAQAARLYVEAHYDQPLEALVRGVGRACQSTRGVVMALAHFSGNVFSFVSIGNIEARLLGSPKPLNFFVRRGILGVNAPPPKVIEHSWGPGRTLILHSDGLKAHWQWEDFPGLEYEPAQVIAQRLMRGLAREQDDATVLVVKDCSR